MVTTCRMAGYEVRRHHSLPLHLAHLLVLSNIIILYKRSNFKFNNLFQFLNTLYILYVNIVKKAIKYQAMRVRIIYDSKNQTIGNDARHYFLDCAHKQADNSE